MKVGARMIPDNYDLWEQHDAEQERQLAKLPVCTYCGEHIQDDYLYLINDEIMCMDCLNDRYRHSTEYFMRLEE